VRGKVLVAPLPQGSSGRRAATIGGWQLGVSAKSRHAREAADLVRFLTSAEVQKARAIELGQPPSLGALYEDADVLAANPHFQVIREAMKEAVARPSTEAGGRYNEVSTAFFTTVHEVLAGAIEPGAAVTGLEARLRRISQRQ